MTSLEVIDLSSDEETCMIGMGAEADNSSSETESVNCRELEVFLEENKKLQAQCHEYDANEKKLEERVRDLENKLQEVKREYEELLTEAQSLGIVKEET